MIILRARDIPLGLIDFFEPVQAGSTDVLTPKPSPLGLKHFAAYPPSLCKPLIEATCPTRCCPECGMGWSPTMERSSPTAHNGRTMSSYPNGSTAKRLALLRQAAREQGAEYVNKSRISGYCPSCDCGHDTHIPGTVLDPFLGSGTTALVAERLGLNTIGIEISETYAQMSKDRIIGDAPMLTNVEIDGAYLPAARAAWRPPTPR